MYVLRDAEIREINEDILYIIYNEVEKITENVYIGILKRDGDKADFDIVYNENNMLEYKNSMYKISKNFIFILKDEYIVDILDIKTLNSVIDYCSKDSVLTGIGEDVIITYDNSICEYTIRDSKMAEIENKYSYIVFARSVGKYVSIIGSTRRGSDADFRLDIIDIEKRRCLMDSLRK